MNQNNSLLLSIIVPAYNAGQFISACLHSVFDQVDERVEVILIDDGSVDNTEDIVLSEFGAHIDAAILKIIRQANAGPGAARNRGLNIASAKYITFLDSDDLLLEGYFREISPILERDAHDIVEHGFVRFCNSLELIDMKYEPLYEYRGSYVLEYIRNRVFARTVWYPSIRIYRSNVWRDLRFEEGVFYEDPMTIYKIFLRDYFVYYTGKPFLGYRLNPKSTTANHSISHMLDLSNFYFSLHEKDGPVEVKILKVRLARSMVYFYHEFGAHQNIVKAILSDIESMGRTFEMLRNLRGVDLFFVLFTKTYLLIDRMRVRRLRG